MELEIFFERERRTEKIAFAGTRVQELLSHLAINPETVLVVQDKEVLTGTEPLKPGKITLLSVISGG